MRNVVAQGGAPYNLQVSSVMRDGKVIYKLNGDDKVKQREARESRKAKKSERLFTSQSSIYTVKAAERLAKSDPHHQWIVTSGPKIYVRQGKRRWMDIAKLPIVLSEKSKLAFNIQGSKIA